MTGVIKMKCGSEISIGEPVKTIERFIYYKSPSPYQTETVVVPVEKLRGFTPPPSIEYPDVNNEEQWGKILEIFSKDFDTPEYTLFTSKPAKDSFFGRYVESEK